MLDETLMMVLRLVHIGAGVFWVGSMFFLNRFVVPSIQEAGPDGGRFATVLMRGGRIQRAMISAAAATIIAGLIMYIGFIVRTDGQWARSTEAMGYGVGAIAAIIAFGLGMIINAPTSRRLQAMAESISGPPSPEQQAEMGRLRGRLASTSRVILILLTVAIISMSVSRYL